jgi:hypothetical protein
MRVGIVGGGLFGCHIASRLKEDGLDVTIYDSGKILSKTTLNNQHRLHLGFHYPRSIDTIEECKSNFDIFLKEYGDCVEFKDNNYYLIHKDSVVSPETIIRNYEVMNLEYDVLDIQDLKDKVRDISKYSYAINTKEGEIDLKKFSNRIKSKIEDIPVVQKRISSSQEDIDFLFHNHDILINLTYENPNLLGDFFELKHEYCILVNLKRNSFFSDSITIMDGPFISLYGATKDEMTLSSVPFTSFLKDNDYENLKARVKDLSEEDLEVAKQNLINHCAEFLSFKESDVEFNRLYLSFKTKLLNDINDTRPSLVKIKGNIVSCLNGKISTVDSTYLKIKGLIG